MPYVVLLLELNPFCSKNNYRSFGTHTFLAVESYVSKTYLRSTTSS
jgi:hypothetical protein